MNDGVKFFDNLHLWQRQTDIDFFSYFMKTWLVFNAWMYHSTKSEKDRKNIEHVKENNNSFKSKTLSFITGDDNDSHTFREHIGNLHLALSKANISNKNQMLTFENAFIGTNPNRHETMNYRGCDFSVIFPSLGNHNHNVEVTRNGTKLLHLSFTTYDLKQLESNADFKNLTDERKNYIKQCYKDANPRLYKNLLSNKTDGTDIIKCGTVNFINDENYLYKGLIEILYSLRCILFHGELVPNKESQKVYEHCYFIIKMIIDRLN
jgi:hypothetical protein